MFIQEKDRRAVQLVRYLVSDQRQKAYMLRHRSQLPQSEGFLFAKSLESERQVDSVLLLNVRQHVLPPLFNLNENDSVKLQAFKLLLHILANDAHDQGLFQQLYVSFCSLKQHFSQLVAEKFDQIAADFIRYKRVTDRQKFYRLLPYLLQSYAADSALIGD